MMSIRLPLSVLAKKQVSAVPKGHFAVYVGESRKRFVIPTSYLNNPTFQALLRRAEEEFGFEHHILAKKQAAPVPKGHFAVYVGESRKRFVIPTSYLNNPTFQALLKRAEEEFGFEHHSGLRIPCNEDAFQALTAQIASVQK
ncbi:Auxin-responsive protein [Nymphaea thermarum]|nr:Auxin-responsive protein [Nymphaea thermarum]